MAYVVDIADCERDTNS